jgi:phosphoribosylamine--glycine ligase
VSARARVIVVGKGGREHALARRLLQSPAVAEVFVAPGNAGTDAWRDPTTGKLLRNATGEVLTLTRELSPDLVVVGPEAPLCEGLVDRLHALGVASYGPTQAAAQLEGSKAFLKQFAVRHRIDTPRHHIVRAESELDRSLADFASAPVVKADGLCAGKGVVVAESHDEARVAALSMLRGEAFGDAGRTLVLEERVYGSELSVHAICDGERARLLPFVQDHKRLLERDQGPNTGGMGTYGPVALPDAGLSDHIQTQIIDKLVAGMIEAGTPFRGTLFANLMLVPNAPPTLFEVNVRFGDPETQVLMDLLGGDLFELLHGAARGRLPSAVEAAAASGQHAMCVILAAAGYPAAPRAGDPISGLQQAEALSGVRVYHAGTVRSGEQTLTAGGRVLAVTGVGATLPAARDRAYAASALIEFAGKQFRADIGAAALR